jgi:PB1 domain
MAPVHFKLSMSDGLTRRISFPTCPSWNELATRIQALCNIPLGRLGVSYVDSDGDEVTLSSDEEWRDFYDSSPDNAIQGNQLIKFRVVELGSLRGGPNLPNLTIPPQSSSRNTFGRPTPLVFEVDHDWEGLPLGNLFIPSSLDHDLDSPHAFVEVLDDDVEKEIEFASNTGSSLAEERNKGKARDLHPFVQDDVSSSPSVIADETPTKPPIHVQVHGLRPMDSGTFGSPPAASTPARESVTPTPAAPPISPSENRAEMAEKDMPGSFPDPPTPELGSPIDPNVSLTNDLASLLDSVNSMFQEHPEVGQHLRLLFWNVGNGSYWNAQRDSMTRVAQDIQRVARQTHAAVATGAQEMAREVRQRAQQEAARRVTEAVGNILRVFGTNGTDPSPLSPTNQGPDAPRASNTDPSGATQMPTHHQMPPPGPPGTFPFYPTPPPVTYQWNPSSRPPPPPRMIPPYGPPMVPAPLQPGVPQPTGMIPPTGMMPPPPPTMGTTPVWNQFKPFPGSLPGSQAPGPSAQPPEVSYYTASTNRVARPSASELRASLEAAKANYKAEKERYRREQEARRRERQLAKEGVGHR